MKLDVSEIKVQNRHRKDMGDLKALADSIGRQGLLQPIGITKDNRLVFGERRLRACCDLLGMSEIDVRVVDVTSIVEGEHDENEMRKEFSVSERVAIANAVTDEIGERRGKPSKDNTDNCPELKGEETRDIAAKKAGFGSGKTLERARNVVESGVQEIVEAMDNGRISISRATEIVKSIPEEQQVDTIKLPSPKQAIKKAQKLGGGRVVLASDMKLYDGRTEEEIESEVEEMMKVSAYFDPLKTLATAEFTVDEFIKFIPDYQHYHVDDYLEKAYERLTELKNKWRTPNVKAAE